MYYVVSYTVFPVLPGPFQGKFRSTLRECYERYISLHEYIWL